MDGSTVIDRPAVPPRDHITEALLYAEDVIDGEIVACRFVRLACERQLRDLRRAHEGDPDFPYRFDPAAAEKACRFLEAMPHVKGEWARRHELIRLEPWQSFVVTTIYGWVHVETGFRRFSTVHLEVARKNAKTTLAGGLMNYHLADDDEAGAEVLAAATKKDQASICFNAARDMIRKAHEIRSRYGIEAQDYRIRIRANGCEAKALDAKGSTQDGLNPSFVVMDELHAWKGRDLYDVLDSATGSRAQPLAFAITTAGFDRAGVCYENRAYAIQVLEGKLADETLFTIIYTLDKPDEEWTDRAKWVKANPNLDVSCYRADLERKFREAKASPSKLNGFLTKRMNVWCSAASAWIDPMKWDACADPTLELEAFRGDEAIAAFDLATRTDFASRILWIVRGDIHYLFARHYVPEDRIDSGIVAQLKGWDRDGWVTACRGDIVDQDRIKRDFLADAEIINIREAVFDRYQAAKLMGELGDLNFECVDLANTVATMSEPMKDIDELVRTKRMRHQGDPVLGWMFANVTCWQDEKENIYPRKVTKDSPLKIDGAVAAILGHNRMMARDDGGNPYDTKDLVVV